MSSLYSNKEACNGCLKAKWHECKECGQIEFCKCVWGYTSRIEPDTGHCPHFARGGIVHQSFMKCN